MSELLKGNFKTKKKVEAAAESEQDLEERFERQALKRLGGSVAFVSKQRVNWALDEKK